MYIMDYEKRLPFPTTSYVRVYCIKGDGVQEPTNAGFAHGTNGVEIYPPPIFPFLHIFPTTFTTPCGKNGVALAVNLVTLSCLFLLYINERDMSTHTY